MRKWKYRHSIVGLEKAGVEFAGVFGNDVIVSGCWFSTISRRHNRFSGLCWRSFYFRSLTSVRHSTTWRGVSSYERLASEGFAAETPTLRGIMKSTVGEVNSSQSTTIESRHRRIIPSKTAKIKKVVLLNITLIFRRCDAGYYRFFIFAVFLCVG